ncbi:MAG TPA: hypothetical protein PL001_08300 [Candidatus Kryptobacter bacterium]|nr:hypothetical protein [Candidatus Kryptobacter bacterium]
MRNFLKKQIVSRKLYKVVPFNRLSLAVLFKDYQTRLFVPVISASPHERLR